MTDSKKVKKTTKKAVEHVALRNLTTSSGQVKKGDTFTCNDKELAIFKKCKAV